MDSRVIRVWCLEWIKFFEYLPLPQRNPELKCLAENAALKTQNFVHFVFYSAGLQ